ncbi:CBS domain-containing protein [Hymenobacter profundi]|uniref:CBS domain-containing protein n=1 Tax=Hymenobacter profundi TaxID=1982110 RepID=A0ABS6WY69_9BACT|nr:CBS domain-containing protein [Hymenobacter profundi]MBW3128544.1 CBS domain-containing protein [Hymenobacter profundi]
MSIQAGHLVHDQIIVSTNLNKSLAETLALMIEHDFSQLPVVDDQHKPLGMVTSDSIARALLHFGAKLQELRVQDALVKVHAFQSDENLLYVLNYLLTASAAFIINTDNKLIGIITNYDTTQYFRQRTEDLVLIGDIESTLRAHLLRAYNVTEEESPEIREAIDSLSNSWDGVRKKAQASLKAFCQTNNYPIVQADIETNVDRHFALKTDPKGFQDLTLSEFIQLAQKAWDKLEPTFCIASTAWCKMMNDVRELRNKLVHLRGDLTPVERHRLRFCAEWFEMHQVSTENNSLPVPTVDVVDNSTSVAIDTQETPEVAVIVATTPLESKSPLATKYAPLLEYLKVVPGSIESFGISITKIMDILQQPLPSAALDHNSWWIEDSEQVQLWLNIGWRVQVANVTSRHIVFLRWRPTKVSLREKWKITYWCNKLGCDENQLRAATRIVGFIPEDIRSIIETFNGLPYSA